MERDLTEQATLLNTRKEYVAWEQHCDEFIESLEEQSRIKCLRLSFGNRQSVIACIARLESLKGSSLVIRSTSTRPSYAVAISLIIKIHLFQSKDKCIYTCNIFNNDKFQQFYDVQNFITRNLKKKSSKRILQFAQSPWLRDYIELNTKFRTLAGSARSPSPRPSTRTQRTIERLAKGGREDEGDDEDETSVVACKAADRGTSPGGSHVSQLAS
ncbi:hypothetical protein ALC57_14655 [Trachymyrmex cornetzi]|uniref:Uncharacterized protein n=1 Tax=Trachymyrmex cornetzi TaxID=471704 RepID=A0A151IY27_9HYME|nr:hypothetical protein ALC57_14655 [Trachymyrmex cornetzi]